ncbi:hypothetical protein ILUMI_14757 [Ignelater luminosus]|uniref:Uncharacterized protein n=1 Tax=Ignelater luminosus TaxID=2038154 RepID=A0A8K0CUC3_IGNLU|nr:hypothetical protein ILUMI_14757 [Ignelater luminosus]
MTQKIARLARKKGLDQSNEDNRKTTSEIEAWTSPLKKNYKFWRNFLQYFRQCHSLDGSLGSHPDVLERQEKSTNGLPNETLTKRGTIRKRKVYSDNPKERRQEINGYYWQLSWHEQKMFVLHNTLKNEVHRRYKPDTEGCYRKMSTYQYFLKDEANKKIAVLYNKTSLDPLKVKDGRGRQPYPRKLPKDDIKENIMSFNLTNSHYRREHVPLRLYLPCDIKVSLMYNDFKNKFPNLICSYDLYRQEVKKLNIAFTKLGNEASEKCD